MLGKRSLPKRNRRVDRYRRACRFEPLEERCLLAVTANYLMVAAPDPVAAEGTDGNTGAWRIMRTGIDVYPCVVYFRIDGPTDFTLQTAIGGDVDLTTQTVDGVTYRTGTALMAPDESEVMLFLVPTNDAKKEETETVSIQITGYVSSIFSYSIGPLTPSITILDNDDWNVSVTGTNSIAAEASAQNFTIKAYDSVYHELYDLAALTIYALDYGLTPYTPQTRYIDPMPIGEADWKRNGVGIRRNNDHDCSTGDNPPPDSVISSANTNEDDLIRVSVNIDSSIPGLTYSVQRSSSALKFWKSYSKSGGEYDFTNNEFTLSQDSDLWTEYTTAGSDNYTLTLVVQETASGMILTTQSMSFRPFNSITCAFVGEFQTPGDDFSESGINSWVVAQLKSGYDIYVWDDGFDETSDPDYVPDCASDGSGRAFAEIVNAVENRGITQVAIVGFSRGGGSVYNLSYALSQVVWSGEGRNPYIFVFTSYIDAVLNEFVTNTVPEIRRPMNSLFHLNQYQLNGAWFGPLFLNIHGDVTSGGTSINTINLQYSLLYHGDMDDSGEVIFWLNNYFFAKVEM